MLPDRDLQKSTSLIIWVPNLWKYRDESGMDNTQTRVATVDRQTPKMANALNVSASRFN